MEITILCPTRKRTWALERMLTSLNATKTTPIEVLLYIDDDDKESLDWAAPSGIRHMTGPHGQNNSQLFNLLLPMAKTDIMMVANDDIIFTEKGWDQKIIQAFESVPDRMCIVHGWNHNREKTFGEHPFVHRDMINVLGYIHPPYFITDYGDHWMWELSERIGDRKSVV
jgi:hypothetical protein